MLGDWGKILTKTPILVLFIVLITAGVGTASALITITLAGDVIVDGNLKSNERFQLSAPTSTSIINRIGDGGSPSKSLGDPGDLFITNDLQVGDNISVGFGNPDNPLLGGSVYISDDLEIDDELDVGGNALIQGNVFVGTIDGDNNDFLCMDGFPCTEALLWDDLFSTFQFTDDLLVEGNLQVGIPPNIVDYNRIGTGTRLSIEIQNNQDLLVTDDLQVLDDFFVEGNTNVQRLFIGTANPNNDDVIQFDDDNELFGWIENTNRFRLTDDLKVDGTIISDGGCIGCMNFYQKDKLPTVVGLNDLSCDIGDQVISGGGWAPGGSPSWIRESWAFDSDTWRLSMTDANGNAVKPGEFRITCADFLPLHVP